MLHNRWLSFIFLLPLAAPSGVAQNYPVQIHGNDEPGMTAPTLVAGSGQDPSAIAELNAFREALGASWNDLEAQGTITYQLAGDDVQGTVSIEFKGGDESRLDTLVNGISSSLRIKGVSGQFQRSNAALQRLNPLDAAAGHFTFTRILASGFPPSSGVLKDGGTATVNGQVLHLITYQQPLPQEGTGPASQVGAWVVNLYFDPSTHLLSKSSVISHGIGVPSRPVVQVMTYGDYEDVNGSQIPMSYSESADGQHLWTIRLTTVHTGAGLDDSDFTF